MDFAAAINGLTEHFDGVYWHIEGLVSFPDLTGFSKQETDIDIFPIEFVKQKGDADYGFNGTIYFPTTYPNGDGGKLYLHVTFSG